MKKTLYAAAALLVLAACNKNEELLVETGDTFNIGLSIAPSASGTKAQFDGDSHIAFESGDALYAALAKKETPNNLIKVASRAGALASVYKASFSIADAAAETPVFNGSFWSIVESDYADEFNLYAVFPSTAFAESSTAAGWSVTIPASQTSSQVSWDKKANALVGRPVSIVPADASYDELYGEYSFNGSLSVEFAHLFGFVKLAFAGVPAEYQDNTVNTVDIEAVGENKDLAGRYTLDVSKKIADIEPKAASPSSVITVTPSESVAVKDLVVWFEANTGVYDVKITVKTDRADLIFEREGLTVNRGEIAAPTVNYKASDVAASHDITLSAGANWGQTAFSYSDLLTSTRTVAEWGPAGNKMKFSVAYPGQTNSNYPTSFSADKGYVQGLAYNTLTGGKVLFYSRSAFHGVRGIKINLGIYNANSSCDAHIGFANGNDTSYVATVNVATDAVQTANGKYYYIDDIDDAEGDFVLLVDNLSAQTIRPTLGGIVLNPVAEFVPEATQIKLEKSAFEGTLNCPLYMTKETPVVETSADWLEASWENGVITYSATENTDVKRVATITLSADGAECEIEVSQKSANQIEYTFSITPDVINPYLEVAAEANPSNTSVAVSGMEFTATATDGSGRTLAVSFDAEYATISPIAEDNFKLRGTFKTGNAIGFIEKVVVKASTRIGTSNYGASCKMSKDGSAYDIISTVSVEGDSAPYVSTITNENEDYTYLCIDCSSWITVIFQEITVTFISE